MSRVAKGWILAVILITGVSLRSYQVIERSIWFDEAFTWRLTNVSFPEIVSRTAQDVHPPLYYIVLKIWTVIFGHSLLALRSFSITLAAVGIVALYILATYAFRSPTIGLLSAAFMSLSGWEIALSQEARMYMFAIVITLLSTWLLLHAIRSKQQRLGWWILYGVSVAALAYTHYYCFFTIAAQGVWWLGYMIAITRGRVGEILQWRVWWYGCIAYALSAVLFIPWVPTFIAQQHQVQQSFWIPTIDRWSVPDTFYRMLIPQVYGPGRETWFKVAVALLPLVFLVLSWLWLVLRPGAYTKKQGDAAWVTVSLILIPFVMSVSVSLLRQSVYQDRYFALTHPFILLSVAATLMALRPTLLRRSATVLAILFFIVAAVHYSRELNIPAKPGVRAAVASLAKSYQNNDPVVVSSSFVFFSVDHYLTESYPLPVKAKLFSENGEVSHFAGGPILNQADIVGSSLFQTEKAVWIVDTTGFGGSELKVPSNWKRDRHESFPEVFGYQGDIIVNHYVKK